MVLEVSIMKENTLIVLGVLQAILTGLFWELITSTSILLLNLYINLNHLIQKDY